MLAVPSVNLLDVEFASPSSHIDQLTIGRQSMLRFAAFDQRITPEVKGAVKAFRLIPFEIANRDSSTTPLASRLTRMSSPNLATTKCFAACRSKPSSRHRRERRSPTRRNRSRINSDAPFVSHNRSLDRDIQAIGGPVPSTEIGLACSLAAGADGQPGEPHRRRLGNDDNRQAH